MTRLLAALGILWATTAPAQAGFKHKFTHLSEIEVILADHGTLSVGPPSGQLPVLVCFEPPDRPRGGDAASGGPIPTLGPGQLPVTALGGFPEGSLPGKPDWAHHPLGPPAGRGPDIRGGPVGGPPAGPLGGSGPETMSAPAPAGLILAGIGIAGLVGYGRWRRPAPPAA